MAVILIGVDDAGEMAVGRAETEAQIARVRGFACALVDEEGPLTWEETVLMHGRDD